MSGEIAKTYDPASIERDAYRVWLEERCFAADVTAPGEPYCIVIPPPNVTGALHLGHALDNTLQDILIRNHRMRGFNTLWVPGLDHAGIATQAVVEKQLKEKEDKTRHDIGRECLVKRIWAWKEEFGDRILEQLKRLGCSCDWERKRFTLDEMCARAVRETFFKLFKDGLIYRGKRLVNWDVLLQTSISDDEIYHETVKTNLWHIRYRIEGTDKFMVVATTRPETLLGDTAVAVHSEDARWNWAIGRLVELPLTGRKIPIIADDILVDPKFGTGVVKVTPAHDPNDYAVWQRHLGKPDQIDIINILNSDGTLNASAGAYAGKKREAARKLVVDDLVAQGLLEKEEPYETQVGHSDRSKTPIEPYLSDQWFVKMAPLAEPALEVVRQGIIRFFPERHAQQYLSWLGEKRDWPISRQLWWGHRIPVWSLPLNENSRSAFAALRIAPKGEHWHGIDIDDAFAAAQKARVTVDQLSLQSPGELALAYAGVFDRKSASEIPSQLSVCLRQGNSEIEQKLEELGFAQDPDVLDTWFSSALWPHSTLGWPDHTSDLAKWYPTSVLVTGRDIITLWVARMVMAGMYNMGDPAAVAALSPSPCPQGERGGEGLSSSWDKNPHPNPLPEYKERGSDRSEVSLAREKQLGIPFRHVAIHPTILDGKGERMSKSKGNGVDPVDVIDTHGADALRFTLALMATETQDVRMPVRKDAQGRNTSEKFDIGSRFCNKIWQVAHFFAIPNLAAIAPEPVDESKWTLSDRWIVSRFGAAVREANAAMEVYRFDQYAKTCYDFFYGDFCDWYVEAAKPLLKNPATVGQTANVLAAILDGSLRLMHPMIPFITETTWWRLNEVRLERGLPGKIESVGEKRLIKAVWPSTAPQDDQAEQSFERVREVIGAIRKLRNEYKVDVKKVIDVSILAPGDLGGPLESNRAIVELLATCAIKAISPTLSPPADAIRVAAGGCDIFVQGLIDPEAEKQRLVKIIEDKTKEIQTLKGRLANQAYIAKAPPQLVKQTKDQLAQAEAELQQAQAELAKLIKPR
jgi:valyl-tRNA synthetase